MSEIKRSAPGAYDAAAEEELTRLASRLSDDADLELEDVYRRANQRLEEDFGYAVAQGVPAELRLEQLGDDLPFVGAIAVGFGTQVGLFAYLRGLHARASAGGVAASTGTSTAAMLACCAHHLVDVAPALGVSGAAIFLNAYKTPLLWLGIVMNLVGILYLSRKIRQARKAAC